MKKRTLRRKLTAGLAAGFVAVSGLSLGVAFGTVAGPAAPALAHGDSCKVESADLSWGLKTSFRNYISGSIANGEWQLENGTEYETPAFRWANGTGSFAEDLEEGSVAFTGDVFFSGHDGLLRLNVSNPEIVFTGEDSAQLLLDIGSDDTGEAEIVQERIVTAKVDLAGYDAGTGQSFAVTDAPVRLTAEGAEALNGAFGDYVAGEEMDPLSMNISVTGCSLTSSTASPAEPSASPETGNADGAPIDTAPEAEPEIPWLPIGIGAAALVVVGVTTGLLISGRKKRE